MTPAVILEIIRAILEIIDKILAIHLKNLEVIPKEEQEKAWVQFYRGLNVWLAMLEKMGNALLAAITAAMPQVVVPPPKEP